MTPDPQPFYIGQSGITPCEEPSRDVAEDPRGLLLMWEEPRKNARYVMGMDSAEGITGWSRGRRSENDHKKDNSVIEIFRVQGATELVWKEDQEGNRVPEIDPKTKKQRIRYRDVQVAEFAAPIDPVDASRIADFLGRLYRGDAEEQCEFIWESWPGCGMMATQEILRLGYANPWYWEHFANVEIEQTRALGWHSSPKSQLMLWQRSRRHYINRGALIRSKWLKSELATAQHDSDKQRAQAGYGFHDDRIQAANMALWIANKWVYDVERTWEETTDQVPDQEDDYWQRHAPVLGQEVLSFKDWKTRAVEDWLD